MKYQILFIDEPPNIELIEGEDGELLISIPVSEIPDEIPQYYGFSKGRHSGSTFLKIGAAIFCAMHITHLCLVIGKEVISLFVEAEIKLSNFKKLYKTYRILDIFLQFYTF